MFKKPALIFFTFVWIFIFYSCSTQNKKQENKDITFSKDIAPLIYKNCTPCHRPGSGGPYSLITYNDVLKKAKTIVAVTQSRFMPPWPADATYTHFVSEKKLSQNEIDKIKIWVQNGCPVGDSTKIPEPPKFNEGSQIGQPDMVVKFPQEIKIEGNNRDNFFLAKVPYQMPNDKFVRTIEFVPGNKKLLHHMNANVIQYKPGDKKNVFGGEKVIPTNNTLSADEVNTRMENKNDDGTYPILVPLVCNYLPGVSPAIYPKGIGGFKMSRQGAFFINDVHYGPSPIDTFDNGSHFNIFFSDAPPVRPTYEILIGSLSENKIEPPLVIPPNEIKTFTAKYLVQTDMSVLTINPHMHLLGKTFLAYALTPQQDTIRLVRINKWDFRWQYFYTFKNPLKIPAGSVIYVVGTYDNTVNNPNNPFNPPQVIIDRATPFESMKTTNEMMQFFITYLPYKPGDEKIDLENVSLK